MNYHRKGLRRLLTEIFAGRVGRRVITHKDRLLRLGAELVFAVCKGREVEVVILNQGEDASFEEDLAEDVLEIITVFSARLYGSRSHKSQKLIDSMGEAARRRSADGPQDRPRSQRPSGHGSGKSRRDRPLLLQLGAGGVGASV